MEKRYRLTVAVLLCLHLCFLNACGKTMPETKISVDMEALRADMMKADTTLPEMLVVDSGGERAKQNFTVLSDVDYQLVSSYFYAYAKEGTAEEIAVVCMKDKADVAQMMDSLKKHIKDREGTFRVYAPEQLRLTENAVVTRNGTCVALIISKKNGLVQKVFKKSIT